MNEKAQALFSTSMLRKQSISARDSDELCKKTFMSQRSFLTSFNINIFSRRLLHSFFE